MIERPTESEYAPFYAGYISKIQGENVLEILENQSSELRRLAASTTPEREVFRYAPGKWSVREVFGHLTDGERIFGYRAFRIGRGDQTPLPGFDENTYVAASGYQDRDLSSLVEEFSLVRAGNLAILRNLAGEAWARVGTANNYPVSVRALAYIMAGHVRHHLGILSEKYGLEAVTPPVSP